MIIITKYTGNLDHLTIALTGIGDQNIYLSFFPSDLPIKEFKLHRFKEDQSHQADALVILPSEESCGFGLSENAIYDWWKNKFDPHNENFNLIFNNCSSIVYRALLEGLQARSLPQTLRETKWICTPDSVIHYAENLNKKIYNLFKNEGKIYLQLHELEQLCDLSHIKKAYTQILAIDLRLKNFNNDEYHLLLTKVFNDSIRNILIQNGIQIENISDDQLFEHLTQLANKCYKSNLANIFSFEQSVNVCLKQFKNILVKYKYFAITKEKFIPQLLKCIENKINDDNNPKNLFFKKHENQNLTDNVTISYYRSIGR